MSTTSGVKCNMRRVAPRQPLERPEVSPREAASEPRLDLDQDAVSSGRGAPIRGVEEHLPGEIEELDLRGESVGFLGGLPDLPESDLGLGELQEPDPPGEFDTELSDMDLEP